MVGRVEKVHLLAGMLIFSFCFFAIESACLFVCNLLAVFAVAFLVGVLGGTVFFNSVDQINKSSVLSKTKKELAQNMLLISCDAGIVSAGLTSLVLTSILFPQRD